MACYRHEQLSPETTTQSTTSHFQNIPPELRNQIYQIIAAEYSDVHFLGSKIIEVEQASDLKRAIPRHPTVSLICKQIHEEFHSIYVAQVLRAKGAVYLHIDNFELESVLEFCRLAKQPGFTADSLGGRALVISLHLDRQAFQSLHTFAESIVDHAYDYSPRFNLRMAEKPFRKISHQAFFRTQKNRRSGKRSVILSSGERHNLAQVLESLSGFQDFASREMAIAWDLAWAVRYKHQGMQVLAAKARRARTKTKVRVIEELRTEG